MGLCECLHGVGAEIPEVSIQREESPHCLSPPAIGQGRLGKSCPASGARQTASTSGEGGLGRGGQVPDQVGQQVDLELL